jgi:E-phenylitaconyl-CoA hydratase
MSVQVTVNDYVALVKLNRPEAMNSIDPSMRSLLRDTWHSLGANDAVRAIIITGEGERAFCTGSDLKKTMPPSESFASLTFNRSRNDQILDGFPSDKPTIAAINGHALGGGLEIALACDIRIASTTASFALPEVKIGSIPGSGGTVRLPRTIGRSDAMMMLLCGDRIDAMEARRIGLVSRVFEPDQLLPEAQAIAQKIAANAPLAVRAVKRIVERTAEMSMPAALDMERMIFGLLRDTEDRVEGRKAFAEKRAAVYRGL